MTGYFTLYCSCPSGQQECTTVYGHTLSTEVATTHTELQWCRRSCGDGCFLLLHIRNAQLLLGNERQSFFRLSTDGYKLRLSTYHLHTGLPEASIVTNTPQLWLDPLRIPQLQPPFRVILHILNSDRNYYEN